MSKAGAGRAFQGRTTGQVWDPRSRRDANGRATLFHVEHPLEYSTETGRLRLKPSRAVQDASVNVAAESANATRTVPLTINGYDDVTPQEYSGSDTATFGWSMDTNSGGSELYCTWLVPDDFRSGGEVNLTVHFYRDDANAETDKFVSFDVKVHSHSFADAVSTKTATVEGGDAPFGDSAGESNFLELSLTGLLASDADIALLEIERMNAAGPTPLNTLHAIVYAVTITYQTVPLSAAANPEFAALKAEVAALKQSLRAGGVLEK